MPFTLSQNYKKRHYSEKVKRVDMELDTFNEKPIPKQEAGEESDEYIEFSM